MSGAARFLLLLAPKATAPPTIPTANLLAEHRFNAGSGQLLANYANTPVTSGPVVNLFGAPEQLFSDTGRWAGTHTCTDIGAADPLGGANASRFVGAGGASFGLSQSVALPAGNATVSIYVKSNTGASQTFRMSLDNTATFSGDMTATTDWQRFSYTKSVSAGTTGRFAITYDAAKDALDLLIYGAQLEVGASATAYVPPVWDGVLGKFGAADSADPAWNAGGWLEMQGSKFVLGQQKVPPVVTALSAYAVCRWTGTPVLAGFAPVLTDGSTANTFVLSAAYNNLTFPVLRFSSGLLRVYLSNIRDSTWHVLACTYDGTTLSFYLDGTLLGTVTSAGLSVTLRTLYWGWYADVGYFPGDIAYTLLYSAGHNAATVQTTTQALTSAMAARSITITPLAKVVAAEGDSITEANSAPSFGYPTLAQTAHPGAFYGTNFAVSGSSIATVSARAATVDALYSASRPKNVLSVLLGANDLGGTPESFIAALKTYCLARKAVGWQVLVCTILPRTAAGFNTKRATANGLIAGDTSFYDALCDFAADPVMGPDAAASDVSLYSDGTHPTAAGQANLAPIWYAALATLL